jgi:hypothetical protein
MGQGQSAEQAMLAARNKCVRKIMDARVTLGSIDGENLIVTPDGTVCTFELRVKITSTSDYRIFLILTRTYGNEWFGYSDVSTLGLKPDVFPLEDVAKITTAQQVCDLVNECVKCNWTPADES